MATNLGQLLPTFFVGKNGERLTENQLRQRQAIANSLLSQATDTSPNAGGWASILAKGAQGALSGYKTHQIDQSLAADAAATKAADDSFWGGLTGGAPSTVPMPTAAGEVAATSPAPSNWNPSSIDPSIKTGIASTATALGINPVDLATAISYETGGTFNPTQGGPTTQWGQHRGLIQFGEPQAKQYGVNWDDPINSQLGENGAVANYLRSTGVKPGMGLLDIYSAINAGGVGRYDRSDANNGGAPGTVADKVNNQMAAHRAKALALFGDTASAAAAPQTATDAINTQSPPPPNTNYVDPQVTTAYQAPMPVESAPLAPIGQPEVVSAPTMAPSQDISPVAQALVSQPTEAVKGGRVGAPFDQGRFASPEASPVFDINAAMQPQEAAPQQASPVAQTLASQAPQQAPFSIPQPQLRTAPPLNPGVIAALRNPDTSPETRRVAAALYQQNLAQQQAVQEENLKIQQGQQGIQQRVQVAQQLGINPANALDDETWKQAVQAASGGAKFINAGDGNIYNSQTGEWVQAPNSGKNFRQATPDEVKMYGVNGQVGPDGRFYPVQPPQGTNLSVDPTTGAVTFNQGAGVKPLTESQSKDSFFATRMTSALPTLDANENALLSLSGKAADSIPLNLGNYAQSEDYQLAKDAGRDFVLAYLRKDSGAALTPAEERTYGELLLPQPGDKKERLAAKRQRRQVALEAIKSGMPPQAVDGVLKAIQAVPGADKAITPQKIGGYTVEEVTD